MISRYVSTTTLLVLLGLLGGCGTHYAARAGDTKTLVKLLDEGANMHETDRLGEMPLHWAVCSDREPLEKTRVLLDRGANVNARAKHLNVHGAYYPEDDDATPLHFAAYCGREDVAKLLLDHGADPLAKTVGGRTASSIASREHLGRLSLVLKQVEDATHTQASRVGNVEASRIIVSDVDRVPTVKTTAKKHAYAVVIGIEQYREKLPKADFADRDAKLVGEYLTKVLGYPEENVIVRTNDRATRTDLVKYFEEWLRNNVEKDSSVFVYYSGHGAPNTKTGEAYFVPYDGDPSFVDSTAYPVKQLYAALDKLPAKDITVVLDSCFSGAGGRSVLAKGARPMGLSIENATLASGKTVVLAASGGDQISNSFEEKGHGLLTYYFLKGLQGEGDGNKDGTIEMAELYDYVKPNVQRVARKQYNNEQTPQLLASPELLKRGGGRLLERGRP
jgi:hypothetical protein